MDYQSTGETFGIAKMSKDFLKQFQMEEASVDTSTVHDVVPSLPTKINRKFENSYDYLAHAQGSRFAIVPVHTIQEKKLFKSLIDSNPSMSKAKALKDWEAFCSIWSSHCNGRTIYYKSPQHLQSYYNVLKDRNNYYNSIVKNADIVRRVRRIVSSQDREIVEIPTVELQQRHKNEVHRTKSTAKASVTIGGSTVVQEEQVRENQAQVRNNYSSSFTPQQSQFCTPSYPMMPLNYAPIPPTVGFNHYQVPMFANMNTQPIMYHSPMPVQAPTPSEQPRPMMYHSSVPVQPPTPLNPPRYTSGTVNSSPQCTQFQVIRFDNGENHNTSRMEDFVQTHKDLAPRKLVKRKRT